MTTSLKNRGGDEKVSVFSFYSDDLPKPSSLGKVKSGSPKKEASDIQEAPVVEDSCGSQGAGTDRVPLPFKRWAPAEVLYAQDFASRAVSLSLESLGQSAQSAKAIKRVAQQDGKKQWESLSDEEKAVYHRKEAEARERYQAEVAAWNDEHPDDKVVVNKLGFATRPPQKKARQDGKAIKAAKARAKKAAKFDALPPSMKLIARQAKKALLEQTPRKRAPKDDEEEEYDSKSDCNSDEEDEDIDFSDPDDGPELQYGVDQDGEDVARPDEGDEDDSALSDGDEDVKPRPQARPPKRKSTAAGGAPAAEALPEEGRRPQKQIKAEVASAAHVGKKSTAAGKESVKAAGKDSSKEQTDASRLANGRRRTRASAHENLPPPNCASLEGGVDAPAAVPGELAKTPRATTVCRAEAIDRDDGEYGGEYDFDKEDTPVAAQKVVRRKSADSKATSKKASGGGRQLRRAAKAAP